jgi:Asp-tRNA(Asn)/Glu-tRNA(Gln) amidotransferase A subunit family amidase
MLDLAECSAVDLRRHLAQGTISSRELLRAVRERIERLNPSLNAFVEMSWERAERDAAAAERARRGGDLPPLFGLPVAVKEATNVEGLHTTLGSALYADRVAEEDAPTVTAIRSAGGIIVGKTNVPELLQGGTSRNTLYGLTRNAFDPSRSCSGSSGGSAVALSASMVPLATGSDMGGSIRGASSSWPAASLPEPPTTGSRVG